MKYVKPPCVLKKVKKQFLVQVSLKMQYIFYMHISLISRMPCVDQNKLDLSACNSF